jgi:hypothetical protein
MFSGKNFLVLLRPDSGKRWRLQTSGKEVTLCKTIGKEATLCKFKNIFIQPCNVRI